MKLKKFRATNFRLLEEFELELHDSMSVLLGPNNVGKSNIVDALLFIRDSTTGSVRQSIEQRHGYNRITSRQESSRQISFDLEFSEDSTLMFTFDSQGLVKEQLHLLGNCRYDALRQSTGSGTFLRTSIPNVPPGSMANIVENAPLFVTGLSYPENIQAHIEFLKGIIHVDPFRNVSSEALIGIKSTIEPTGSDLAQVLHYHYNEDREIFDAFQSVVREVLPEVDAIETPLRSKGSVTVQIRFKYARVKHDLSELSSGIKGVLVLLAAAHFSPERRLVIIEEPENHLHPAAQKELCAVLKKIATRDEKQFIITTHSESVFAQFPPQQCFYLDRSANSGTHATPLSETDVYLTCEKLGIEKSLLLTMLGRTRQAVVILEGRIDRQVMEAFWREEGVSERLIAGRAEGGGWQEIVDKAAQLRDALVRFRLPSKVFILFDNDGEGAAKTAYLFAHGFDADNSHVFREKEIESYMFLPGALSAISCRPAAEVRSLVDQVRTRDKASFHRLLEQLGIPDMLPSVLITNALRTHPEEIPVELREMTRKLRKLAGEET